MARTIALVLTGLGIAVTQAFALLGGHAASLIGGAIKARPKAKAKRKLRKKAAAKPAKSNAERQRDYRERQKATKLTVVK